MNKEGGREKGRGEDREGGRRKEGKERERERKVLISYIERLNCTVK